MWRYSFHSLKSSTEHFISVRFIHHFWLLKNFHLYRLCSGVQESVWCLPENGLGYWPVLEISSSSCMCQTCEHSLCTVLTVMETAHPTEDWKAVDSTTSSHSLLTPCTAVSYTLGKGFHHNFRNQRHSWCAHCFYFRTLGRSRMTFARNKRLLRALSTGDRLYIGTAITSWCSNTWCLSFMQIRDFIQTLEDRHWKTFLLFTLG